MADGEKWSYARLHWMWGWLVDADRRRLPDEFPRHRYALTVAPELISWADAIESINEAAYDDEQLREGVGLDRIMTWLGQEGWELVSVVERKGPEVLKLDHWTSHGIEAEFSGELVFKRRLR